MVIHDYHIKLQYVFNIFNIDFLRLDYVRDNEIYKI